MFHKHDFQKEGNNIWCKCGKIKRLPCDHDWLIHSQSCVIGIFRNRQTQQTLKCKKCGDWKSVNTTTGEIE